MWVWLEGEESPESWLSLLLLADTSGKLVVRQLSTKQPNPQRKSSRPSCVWAPSEPQISGKRLWFPPSPRIVKINVYASCNPRGFIGHVGVVARNSSKTCITIRTRQVWRVVSLPNSGIFPESWLNLTENRYLMFKQWHQHLQLGHLPHPWPYFEAWKLLSSMFGKWNGTLLAMHYGAEMRYLVWVERPPSSFVRILNRDRLQCPPL